MNVYRYLFGTTLVDIIVAEGGDGKYVATPYVVFQGSLARRPVLDGRRVLSSTAEKEHQARRGGGHARIALCADAANTLGG